MGSLHGLYQYCMVPSIILKNKKKSNLILFNMVINCIHGALSKTKQSWTGNLIKSFPNLRCKCFLNLTFYKVHCNLDRVP